MQWSEGRQRKASESVSTTVCRKAEATDPDHREGFEPSVASHSARAREGRHLLIPQTPQKKVRTFTLLMFIAFRMSFSPWFSRQREGNWVSADSQVHAYLYEHTRARARACVQSIARSVLTGRMAVLCETMSLPAGKKRKPAVA